jgi:hypothetical protein
MDLMQFTEKRITRANPLGISISAISLLRGRALS